MIIDRWEYVRCTLIDIHDGDTITVNIDVGFRVTMMNMKLRLHGINAPELGRPGGAEARDYLKSLLIAPVVRIRTIQDRTEKFGRWLAIVFTDANPANPDETVNDLMISSGHAVPYMTLQV